MKKRPCFRPNLESLELILCLDGAIAAIPNPVTVVPIVVAEIPPPDEVIEGPAPPVIIQDPQPILEKVVTDSFQGVGNALQDGVNNLTQNAVDAANALLGTPTDPAPGPLTLAPQVQVAPDPVGPISATPILPYAPPTTPVPAPAQMPCLVNSCPGTAPYTVAIPYYYDQSEALA